MLEENLIPMDETVRGIKEKLVIEMGVRMLCRRIRRGLEHNSSGSIIKTILQISEGKEIVENEDLAD